MHNQAFNQTKGKYLITVGVKEAFLQQLKESQTKIQYKIKMKEREKDELLEAFEEKKISSNHKGISVISFKKND
jgi:hypothetical protein